MKMNENVETFVGCKSDYDGASIVIFGAPFDSTTSYRPGTRFGSRAIRSESIGLETYSPYQDKDLTEISVFDGGDLELFFGNAEKSLNQIEEYTSRVLNDEKIPCMVGGEHLVTLGAVRAASKKFKDLNIIHFDAHTDLRDEFFGEKLSHATVLKRCHELVGDHRIFQFGIRSGIREEFVWSKEHIFTNKNNFNGLDTVVKQLQGKPVYLTVDLDVMDPSVFPGTGTPEAGGVTFLELLNALFSMASLNIIGFDINELSPHYDPSGVSTAVACKVLRELLLIFGE